MFAQKVNFFLIDFNLALSFLEKIKDFDSPNNFLDLGVGSPYNPSGMTEFDSPPLDRSPYILNSPNTNIASPKTTNRIFAPPLIPDPSPNTNLASPKTTNRIFAPPIIPDLNSPQKLNCVLFPSPKQPLNNSPTKRNFPSIPNLPSPTKPGLRFSPTKTIPFPSISSRNIFKYFTFYILSFPLSS